MTHIAEGVFTEDAEYQNIPMGPAAKGKDAIRKVIDSLMPTVKGLEIKIQNTAANGRDSDSLVVEVTPTNVFAWGFD